MLIKDLEPFVRQAVNSRVTSKTEYDVFFKLKTPDSRLYYILGGEGDMTVAGNTYKLSRGTVITFRPGVEYSWRPAADGYIEYIAINFDMTWEYSHLTKPYHPRHAESFNDTDALVTPKIEDAPELDHPIVLKESAVSESNLRAIVTARAMGGELTPLLLSATMRSILIGLVREVRQQKSGTVSSLGLASQILKYLHLHYTESVDYDTLSEYFHMSPIYLNRVFKRHVKSSIHSYLLSYRISVAMDMLRSGNASVREIATAVGFNDLPHFSKSFKRITGYSPKDYR